MALFDFFFLLRKGSTAKLPVSGFLSFSLRVCVCVCFRTVKMGVGVGLTGWNDMCDSSMLLTARESYKHICINGCSLLALSYFCKGSKYTSRYKMYYTVILLYSSCIFFLTLLVFF